MIIINIDLGKVTNSQELVTLMEKKLKLSGQLTHIGDAYIDLIGELLYKELGGEEFDSEWEYEYDKEFGLKNEKGVRDNLHIIFKNFFLFYCKNEDLAKNFLDFTVSAISSYGQFDEEDQKLKISITLEGQVLTPKIVHGQNNNFSS